MTKPAVSDSLSCPIPSSPRQRDDPSLTDMAKDGVLWVKMPPSARGNSWKAWTKKYVRVRADVIASVDCITHSALVTVFKSEKTIPADQIPKDSDIVFKRWFTPQTTVVFRCKSRTQMYGFTICEAAEPVIHFSSSSESETQEWMSVLRRLLWPPNSFVELEKTLGSVFEVSIIDNEFSFRAGLLGMYGHLSVASRKVILTHPQTGHVIQEWYLSTAGFKLLPQSNAHDADKVVTMITDANSSTGYGTIVMFCKEGAELIKRLHQVRLMFDDSGYGEKVTREIMATPTDEMGSLGDSYSKYKKPSAQPRPVPQSIDTADIYEQHSPRFSFSRPLSESNILDCGLESSGGSESPHTMSMSPSSPPRASHLRRGQSRLFSWKNVANIPESMLDCSISSSLLTRSLSRPMSDISNSSSDGLSKVDFFIGDESEMSRRQLSHTEIEEEDVDENMYAEFHQAIAEEEDMEMMEDEEDIPPPLPPKTRKASNLSSVAITPLGTSTKLTSSNSHSLEDLSSRPAFETHEKQDATNCRVPDPRKRSLTLNVIIREGRH